MTSIFELLIKLPTPTDVAITCYSKNNLLFPLKDAIHNLQLTYYWWKEAQDELDKYRGEEIVEKTEDKMSYPQPPTLIGATEQLNFIKQHLRELGNNTQEFLDGAPLPTTVKYKIEQGYNKVMDALFNTDISLKYNEEINREIARRENS